jgi:hypothetical protein
MGKVFCSHYCNYRDSVGHPRRHEFRLEAHKPECCSGGSGFSTMSLRPRWRVDLRTQKERRHE